MCVSSDSARQDTNLQRDALLTAGVDARNLYEDRASGAKDDRPGLTVAALNAGMSKAAVCRTFEVKRTTLIETIARIGGLGST
jgi:hypothetical protein